MPESLRRRLKRLSFLGFIGLDRLGLHVLPKHYYTPIADRAWLRSNLELWARRSEMVGVYWDLDKQLSWLEALCTPYAGEVAGLGFYSSVSGQGPGYGVIESQILHSFIRATKPKRIVEIGSGVSTACMLHALEMNELEGGQRSSVTCIEPFPKNEFERSDRIQHIEELCQAVPIAVFKELRDGDLLFIDSSHSLKTGSDVSRIYLDIIPALSPGVIVHIHDVYLPYVYAPDVLTSYFDWQETSFLLALLTNNIRLEILACVSALHYDRSDDLKRLLPDYVPAYAERGLSSPTGASGHYPSSFWMQVT